MQYLNPAQISEWIKPSYPVELLDFAATIFGRHGYCHIGLVNWVSSDGTGEDASSSRCWVDLGNLSDNEEKEKLTIYLLEQLRPIGCLQVHKSDTKFL